MLLCWHYSYLVRVLRHPLSLSSLASPSFGLLAYFVFCFIVQTSVPCYNSLFKFGFRVLRLRYILTSIRSPYISPPKGELVFSKKSYICPTIMACERSRASGTIRPTLKTVDFAASFSSARPLDILHFGKLDDAVQCFSICAYLSPARDLACEQSYGCPKSEGDASKNTCHPGFVENCHPSKLNFRKFC